MTLWFTLDDVQARRVRKQEGGVFEVSKVDNIRQSSWQAIEVNLCGLMLLEGDYWLN